MALESGPEGSGPLIALAALVVGMGALLVKMVGKITNKPPKDDSTASATCVAIQKDIESIKEDISTILGTLKEHKSTHHDIYAKAEITTNDVARIKGKLDL